MNNPVPECTRVGHACMSYPASCRAYERLVLPRRHPLPDTIPVQLAVSDDPAVHYWASFQ